MYANEYKKKPNINAFEIIKKNTSDPDLKNYLMIGDSEIDKRFSQNCKIDFIWINDFLSKMDLH